MVETEKFQRGIPRIVSIKIENYRALKRLELNNLTPLTVLLGPNGSGKSTVFDVFAFLAECFNDGLRRAWDRRGRFKELLTRGASGNIKFELKYREQSDQPLITYNLSIGERDEKEPFVAEESLKWRRGEKHGQPYKFLDFHCGKGEVASDPNDAKSHREKESLASDELLAVNTLGQFAKHPLVSALRHFITDWHLSYLSANSIRGIPEAGPQERLSRDGDNLPNVIQYLREQHPERLEAVLNTLRERVPRLQGVIADIMQDGRLLLQVKDKPFERPILAKFVSDGTLKMLAYLVLLFEPSPPQLIGIEEPENYLHPRLLLGLAEECRKASGRSQLLVTTHSPMFVSGIKPEELWVLFRDENGYSDARNAAAMRGVKEFMDAGAQLGDLWIEGNFDVGDPLINSGGPRSERLFKDYDNASN